MENPAARFLNEGDEQRRLLERESFLQVLQSDLEAAKGDPTLGPIFRKLSVEVLGDPMPRALSDAFPLSFKYNIRLKETEEESFTVEDAEELVRNPSLVPNSVRDLSEIYGTLVEVTYSPAGDEWVILRHSPESVEIQRHYIRRGEGWPEGSPEWFSEKMGHLESKRASLFDDHYVRTREFMTGSDKLRKEVLEEVRAIVETMPPENIDAAVTLWKNKHPRNLFVELCDEVLASR